MRVRGCIQSCWNGLIGGRLSSWSRSLTVSAWIAWTSTSSRGCRQGWGICCSVQILVRRSAELGEGDLGCWGRWWPASAHGSCQGCSMLWASSEAAERSIHRSNLGGSRCTGRLVTPGSSRLIVTSSAPRWRCPTSAQWRPGYCTQWLGHSAQHDLLDLEEDPRSFGKPRSSSSPSSARRSQIPPALLFAHMLGMLDGHSYILNSNTIDFNTAANQASAS